VALFGKGKGTAHVVIRSLVSLELARMTNFFGLEFLKVPSFKSPVILNNEGRGDSESIVRLRFDLRSMLKSWSALLLEP
jgi:hypothetical protein